MESRPKQIRTQTGPFVLPNPRRGKTLNALLTLQTSELESRGTMGLTRVVRTLPCPEVIEERNRMAREIHDTLAQQFAGIFLNLEAANRLDNPQQQNISEYLARAKDLAKCGLEDARRMLLGDVARNYVDLRGYQGRLAIAHKNIEAQERALAITRDRFAKGLASDLDVQQASTVLATTRAEVPTLESSVQTTMHRLEVLLGQQTRTLPAELAQTSAIPAQPPLVPVGLPSELLLRRPDIRQAERHLAAATANIGVAKSDLFPKFFLTGSPLGASAPPPTGSQESRTLANGRNLRFAGKGLGAPRRKR